MKPFLALLFIAAIAAGQQRPQTGNASSTGTCSPSNTGNNNVFTINCGVGQAQGRRMLELLNQILTKQLDPDVVIAKLDEIRAGVDELKKANAARHLSESQKALLTERLSKAPKTKVNILIRNSNPETVEFSNEFLAIFRVLGWTVEGPVFDLEPSTARGMGMAVKSEAEHLKGMEILYLSLKDFGFAPEAGLDEKLSSDEFRFVIAPKAN